ncbi:MAG: bifunctional enoyl-CoA hydratase/phosphate acetyltransferase [Pseudomonadota bacterium]
MTTTTGLLPHFARLCEMARALPTAPVAVVSPEEPNALGGALMAAELDLITPILIGDAAKMQAAAGELGKTLDGFEIIDEPSHAAAPKRAVEMVHEGKATVIMKGHLHTDQLLRPIFTSNGGLRTGRQISHVFVMDIPGFDRMLTITDAAINIAPDLKVKVDIAQNAIHLQKALGVEAPKVAVVSAVETVNPAMPTTLEAAALAKMADRGQIKGGFVDGPFAMDNALNEAAAATKGITSPVAGKADIILAPNMEAGNMMVKLLTFAAGAQTAGLVLGAKCPVILTSRADDANSRVASVAAAALYAKALAS